MPRAWIWLQLAIGWLPVWAVYTTLVLSAHPGTPPMHAGLTALRAVVAAALLGLAVHRLTARVPWPHPFRVRFLLVHVAAGPVYAVAWVTINTAVESVLRGAPRLALPPVGAVPYVILGIWLYVMVAGASYAVRATARAASAEALAAQSQLAALRAQINPHFLFNALHTVVHLIPRDPRGAARAAEEVAALLRTALEEDRDLVPLEDEWTFVARYLEVERLRFGDRLQVQSDLSDEARDAMIPAFALQTLVENAVRHGAAPRVEPTTIAISAACADDQLTVTVADTGVGAAAGRLTEGGTGLARLRRRVAALYGERGALEARPNARQGFTATLRVPQ